jgi:hypothetical protein
MVDGFYELFFANFYKKLWKKMKIIILYCRRVEGRAPAAAHWMEEEAWLSPPP